MTQLEMLREGARELGIELTAEQQNSMIVYASELKKWNKKINLTAITDNTEIIIKHFLDSLSYGTIIPLEDKMSLIDIGSGAGFPAIPIKIAHHNSLEILMVETSKKKASFLRHIIRLLHLTDIEVIDARVESIQNEYNEIFDLVTARAFADVRTVVEVGTPLLKFGGHFILSRGPEESADDGILKRMNVEIIKKKDLILPGSDYRRTIWLLRKNARESGTEL